MGKRRAADYFNLTPGARAAQRGSSATRPWHQHWGKEQTIAICNQVVENPWVQSMLGSSIDVSVSIAEDGSSISFTFATMHGGMGGMPPMQSIGSR